jgi:hypothetical protein
MAGKTHRGKEIGIEEVIKSINAALFSQYFFYFFLK